ncbi:MAG: hypothetical protein ACJA09_001323 [Alcanivorax sp.]|jgi:hypothetical protein
MQANQNTISTLVERFDTPAMEIQSVSTPINLPQSSALVSRAQLANAFKIWGKGDKRFIPSFVESTIVEEKDNQLVKDIRHYGKSIMADGSPNLQRTWFRDDNLMMTEYLGGPWFMVIAGIDEREDGEICLQLTTIRHKQHTDYLSPAELAKRNGAAKPPPTTEQNTYRIAGIIRGLAEAGEL